MNPFDELQKTIDAGLAAKYHKMTDEEFHASNIDELIEYASDIQGQWHDSLRARDNDPAQERSYVAGDIVEKCNEIKELLTYLGEI